MQGVGHKVKMSDFALLQREGVSLQSWILLLAVPKLGWFALSPEVGPADSHIGSPVKSDRIEARPFFGRTPGSDMERAQN